MIRNILILIVITIVGVTSFVYVRTLWPAGAPIEGLRPTPTLIPTPTQLVSEIKLDVSEPKNGSTTKETRIRVAGITVANAEVVVNDSEVVADTRGRFEAYIDVYEGENYIFVMAIDPKTFNISEKEVLVTVETF